LENDLKLLQPKSLKNEDFLTELKSLGADLFIVVAFRMLPEVVWAMPAMGTINLHGSMLPDYRGAAPINWAVINGDKETGVSTFYIQQKIDTGRIIEQRKIAIAREDTAGDLYMRMMEIGANTLLNTIDMQAQNKIQATEQEWNENYRKAPKIFKEDCKVEWDDNAESIYNKIRGLSPYPTAFTILIDEDETKKSLKIFFAEIDKNHKLNPGEVKMIGQEKLLIGTKDFALNIKDLQFEGKKRMKIDDFMRGFQTKKTWKTA